MLRLVQKLNAHGIRISRISEMTMDEMDDECKRITLRQEDYDEKLSESLAAMDVTAMDAVIESSIRQHGFESTLLQLILPFMGRMEKMWLSGRIEEGHEACFRELIKRKTLREIETIPQNCSGPKVIMFLPKGNHESLNHHFMHYFLRKQGLCVTDVGCDINLECATSALKNSNAECVLIVNTDHAHWQFGSFVRELTRQTSLPIVISGRAAEEHLQDIDDQIIILDGMEETLRFMSRLKENLQHHVNSI